MDKYQTIGSRFGALIIDSLIIIPIGLLINFVVGIISAGNTRLVFSAQILGSMLGAFYYIYLHGRYGETIGKKVFHVLVVDKSETEAEITYLQSMIRSSPQLVQIFGLILLQASFNSGGGVANEFYLNYGYQTISILLIVWTIADIIVALSNDKHRALHDYIAGTVVIKT